MSAEKWLSLTDYASKYRISVSTLRRRIKSDQIAHRFDEGRYLILDAAPEELETKESPAAHYPGNLFAAEPLPLVEKTQASLDQLRNHSQSSEQGREEPILSSASKLLNELKKAYMSVLQEKEEQIIQLKEEVSDLKTLVRVLEDDNDRMRKHFQGRDLR